MGSAISLSAMGAFARLKIKALGVLIPGSLMRVAVDRESIETASALLDAGFPIERSIRLGQRMIHHAIFCSDEKMMSLAIDRGADLNAPGRSGHSALSQALWQHRDELASILLKAGADPNQRSDGEPPLLRALLNCPESVPDLLRAGADPYAVGRVYQRSREFAFDCPKLAKALRDSVTRAESDKEGACEAICAAQEAAQLRLALGSAHEESDQRPAARAKNRRL